MGTEQVLRCQCGEPIAASDVERIVLVFVGNTPTAYHCRYRCHRCHRIGQALIRPNDWDPSRLFLGGEQLVHSSSTLQETPSSPKPSGPRRHRRDIPSEPITVDEVIDFALALERMTEKDWEELLALAEEE